MQLPMANSQGPIELSRQVLALGVPVIAASTEMMFGNVSADHIKENYFDHLHFNSNGSRRSAEVFGPALQDVASANTRLTNALFSLELCSAFWRFCQLACLLEFLRLIWTPASCTRNFDMSDLLFSTTALVALCYFGHCDCCRAPDAGRRNSQRRLRDYQCCCCLANILYGNAIRRVLDVAIHSILVSILGIASHCTNAIPPSVFTRLCTSNRLASLCQDNRPAVLRWALLHVVPLRSRGVGT